MSLRDPDDFTRFSVAVEGEGDLAAGGARSRASAACGADGEHVVVDPVALRALAGPAADEAWDEGFAGMCAYAAGKGWVEADGGVLAHIERRDDGGLRPATGAEPASGGRSCRVPAGRRYPWGAARRVRRRGRGPPETPGRDAWRFGTTTACSSAATGWPRRGPTPSG